MNAQITIHQKIKNFICIKFLAMAVAILGIGFSNITLANTETRALDLAPGTMVATPSGEQAIAEVSNVNVNTAKPNNTDSSQSTIIANGVFLGDPLASFGDQQQEQKQALPSSWLNGEPEFFKVYE